MSWESSDVVIFDLGPLLRGQTRTPKLESAYNSLIIGLRGLQCETNLKEIMGWESFGVVRFDQWPLLQGQTRIAKIRSAYNSNILGPRGCNVKPSYSTLWARNLLMWSDLTLGFSFKVK